MVKITLYHCPQGTITPVKVKKQFSYTAFARDIVRYHMIHSIEIEDPDRPDYHERIVGHKAIIQWLKNNIHLR